MKKYYGIIRTKESKSEKYFLKKIKLKLQVSACMGIVSIGIIFYSITTEKFGFAYFALAVIIFAFLYSLYAIIEALDFLSNELFEKSSRKGK